MNHSCDSNTWMEDEATLVARRDIESGEEAHCGLCPVYNAIQLDAGSSLSLWFARLPPYDYGR